MPLRSGWLEAGVTASLRSGVEAYAEAGYRFAPRGALFARGFANPQDLGAMAGVRWEF